MKDASTLSRTYEGKLKQISPHEQVTSAFETGIDVNIEVMIQRNVIKLLAEGEKKQGP